MLNYTPTYIPHLTHPTDYSWTARIRVTIRVAVAAFCAWPCPPSTEDFSLSFFLPGPLTSVGFPSGARLVVDEDALPAVLDRTGLVIVRSLTLSVTALIYATQADSVGLVIHDKRE